jgi:hypothetical protein
MPVITRKSTIVGSSFYAGAGNIIMRLRGGEKFRLKREPTNKYDANAIQVGMFKQTLGYVPRGLAAELAPKLDAGVKITAVKIPVMGAAMKLEWEEPDQVPAEDQRFTGLDV